MLRCNSIQHYVIKFVSDLWQVFGFLQVLRVPLPIKLDCHDLTEILSKVVLNTIIQTSSVRVKKYFDIYYLEGYTKNVTMVTKITPFQNKTNAFSLDFKPCVNIGWQMRPNMAIIRHCPHWTSTDYAYKCTF